MQVTHEHGPLLQESHYYPYGLGMAGISSSAINNAATNSYKANGGTELGSGEWADGKGLELYETTFRSFDAQIGRFMQVDREMESSANFGGYTFGLDNPVYYEDPSGLLSRHKGPKIKSSGGQGHYENGNYVCSSCGPDDGARNSTEEGGYDCPSCGSDDGGSGGGGGSSDEGGSGLDAGVWDSFVQQVESNGDDNYSSGNSGGNFGTNESDGYHSSGNGGDPKPGDPKKKKESSFLNGLQSYSSFLWNHALNAFTAAGLTSEWVLGIGSNDTKFYNDRVANALKKSEGILEARENYYKTGKTHGIYNFEHGFLWLGGLFNAGIDPIEQFIGGFSYDITITGKKLQFTIQNQTSFSSAAYHIWPSSWNWTKGPMSNFNQTYIFTEPLKE